jgi:hypothetical protein
MVLLADELLDRLYERLEELRDEIMTRPMRMVGPKQDAETRCQGRRTRRDAAAATPTCRARIRATRGATGSAKGATGRTTGATSKKGSAGGARGAAGVVSRPYKRPPATFAMYVGTPEEYLAGAADVGPLFEIAEPGAQAMLAQGLNATRAKGHQLDERVKAPIFDTAKGGVWVNGKPITGVAILDTGAMPLLVGRAGMEQMGWTDEDVIPNAVRLGLADEKSTQL